MSTRTVTKWVLTSVGVQVVTILLGVFQVLLTAPLAYTDQNLPKFFILPLFLGILVCTSSVQVWTPLTAPVKGQFLFISAWLGFHGDGPT